MLYVTKISIMCVLHEKYKEMLLSLLEEQFKGQIILFLL